MRAWCEVRNFASQKFRLTPAPLLFSKIVKTQDGVYSDTPAPVHLCSMVELTAQMYT